MNTDVTTLIKGRSILMFDGYCNFCSSTVQFVIDKEKTPDLYFCSLQSQAGQAMLKLFNIDPSVTDSLVLIEHDKAYIKSSAALRLSRHLKALYPLLFGFIIVPPFIRNAVYDYIARHRYKWFGKSESCMLPDPKVKARFLEE